MKKLVKVIVLVFLSGSFLAQGIGINETGADPHPSAALDLDFNNKGFLPPRMTTAQRDAIASPPSGLTIYNTTTNCKNYFNSINWVELCGTCTPQPIADAGTFLSANISNSTISDTIFYSNFANPNNGVIPGMTVEGNTGNYYSDGLLRLTPAVSGAIGKAIVDYFPSTPLNIGFEVTFKYFIGGGNNADGIYWAFGPQPDIDLLRQNLSGYENPAVTNNLFQIRFLTWSRNTRRIYYGTSTLGTSGAPARNVWTDMKITISSTGLANVYIDNVLLFTNIQLPPGYVNADKTNFKWLFAGVTGGANDRHEIDDLLIKQTMQLSEIQLGANTPPTGTGTWSVLSGPSYYVFDDVNNPAAAFTGLTGQTYTLRWSVQNNCSTVFDDIIIVF